MEAVLGSGAPPALAGLRPPTSAPDPPRWDGAASQAADEKSRQLHNTRQSLYTAYQGAQRLVEQAGQTITGARTEMAGVHADWERDKAAIAPFAGRPEGQAALAAAGQLRLAEAAHIITTTSEHLSTVATNLHQLTRRLPLAPPTTPGALDFVPKGTGPDAPLDADPNQFHDQWNELSAQEKLAQFEQDRFIGNHGGMPFVDRDFYNRMHLDELQQQNDAELARLRAAHPDWADGKNTAWRIPPQEFKDWKAQWDAAKHTHEGYRAVEESLTSEDGVPRYLSFIDDHGHAAVSIGNPDTAKRTATFVPGTGQDLAAFDASNLKSQKMFNAALDADLSLSKTDVAVTTWMGYDRPMDLLQAASPGRAITGGAALDAYLDGMHASHVGPAAIDTVIGHSYGSTLVGGAATGGNHLAADNVIAVGSPGMLAQHASDLSLETGAHVFATRAENDVIGMATYATLGPDPMAFGAIPFEAADGPSLPFGLPSVAAHGSYWDLENPALINMGRIIAGRLDVTPPTFTP